MNSYLTKTRLSILAAATLLALASPAAIAPAFAYDDDVEVVCGDTDDGDTWCVSVEDLKTECPLSDPEYTGEECQGLLEGRRPIQPSINIFLPNQGDGGFAGGLRSGIGQRG